MNRNFTLAALFCIFLFSFPASSNAKFYKDNGSSKPYHLYSGDTLYLTGNYRGPLQAFTQGAVVFVTRDGGFTPDYINTPSGTIINYGIVTFKNSLGTFGGFTFNNYGIAQFNSNLSMYSSSGQTVTNYYGGTLAIDGGLSLDGGATLVNEGKLAVKNNLNLYASSAKLVNQSTISIGGNFAMSSGTLTNNYMISSAGSFSVYGGSVTNNGEITPDGNLTFSPGSSYVNNCRFVTEKGFNNYGTFQNNGLMWIGQTGTNTDELLNSGTITNAPGAVIRAVKLTNYGTINGSASLYFTGETYNSGTVGRSGNTTDSIRVYDVTRTNSSRIFDTQWGNVHPNTVYRPFTAPEMTLSYAGCSQAYKSTIILPVRWNYFNLNLANNVPVLSWSAEYEPDMQFIIERSYDGVKFHSIGKLSSNSSSIYEYKDGSVNAAEGKAYYRVRGESIDGDKKYTEIKSVVFRTANNNIVSLSPNPVINTAVLYYKANENESLSLQIVAVSGSVMVSKNLKANSGDNRYVIEELSLLPSGVYSLVLSKNGAAIATQKLVKK